MDEKFSKTLKEPKSFIEQMELLKSRKLIVEDEKNALDRLQRVNYYRLSAYMLSFKEGEVFYPGVTLENIFRLYDFDRKLRNLLIGSLEVIEISLRTHIAYYIAHKYGALGYKEPAFVGNQIYHNDNIEQLQREIDRSDELFVKHHHTHYGGNFPIWVVVELTSFGLLSKIYKNMKIEDRETIAKEYYATKEFFLGSWLHSLATLRNICAHYGRLYNREFSISPKLFKEDKKNILREKTLYQMIVVIYRILKNTDEGDEFFDGLSKLFDEYDELDFTLIGFPEDWSTYLKNTK